MSEGSHLIGRTIAGRFRITGLIGEGAMAAVYRGVQEAQPHDVAIKIMHPQLLGDQTFVGRFRREAKAASRLNHPNTVHIVESGVDGRLPYIVMELVLGQDLFDLLASERRLSEARAVRILIGICEALVAAHEQGIVHRDLKPENVMIVREPANSSQGQRDLVKVLDFGIAKIVEGGSRVGDEPPNSISTAALTTVGMVVGTPAYMSPEQCKGDPVDGRSDVYACGILLFLLVTGRLPFPPTSVPWEVAMDHLRTPPPAPSMFLPQIHPTLEAIILTALSKWPEQRQQSALELRNALDRLLPQLPDVAHFAAAGGTLRDAPTLESIPISLRSKVTVSAPMREVQILPAPPLDVAGRSHSERPPPYLGADAPTRAIPVTALAPDESAAPTVIVRDAPLTAISPGREAPLGLAFGATPREPERPLSDAPQSEVPPSSEMMIHHRSDFDALLAATRAAGNAALVQPRPAAPVRKEVVARPSLESLPGVVVATSGADALTPVRRRPQGSSARSTDSWLIPFMVPLAVLFGLVLGVLAFLLSR